VENNASTPTKKDILAIAIPKHAKEKISFPHLHF
jgi:hypothetical protein